MWEVPERFVQKRSSSNLIQVWLYKYTQGLKKFHVGLALFYKTCKTYTLENGNSPCLSTSVDFKIPKILEILLNDQYDRFFIDTEYLYPMSSQMTN